MNTLEDRVRAAAQAAADTVPDGSAPPLRLPRAPRRLGWPAQRHAQRSWIMPLAAAAAVLVVVAASVLVARAIVPGQTVPATGPGPAPALPLSADGLPAYFLVIPARDQQAGAEPGNQNEGVGPIPGRLSSHETLRVVATATGKTVATAVLPGYVTEIAASRGAFFAAVVRGSAATFFEIRLNGSRSGTTVTELPIPPDTAPLEFMAASPNGGRLAYSTLVMHGAAGDVQNLVVASTTKDTEREWLTPQDSQGSMGQMTWLADGRTLAFTWTGPTEASPSSSLRLLDTAAAGDNLMASRAVLPVVNSAGAFGAYTISPNGKVVVGTVGGPQTGVVGGVRVPPGSLVAFSTATRTPSVLYRPLARRAKGQTAYCNNFGPLWISNSGREVLIDCYQQREVDGAKAAVHVVLLDGGRVSYLPWLAATGGETTAFPGVLAVMAMPSAYTGGQASAAGR
jgi:WD40-like Beta Propeller Repeat